MMRSRRVAERALVVSMEGPHPAGSRKHRGTAVLGDEYQRMHRVLPLWRLALEFGKLLVMQRPAYSGVTSAPPLTSSIGSSNKRFQPRSGTRPPIVGHLLAAIKPAPFFGNPRQMIAAFLKISFAVLWQMVAPCAFERGARRLENSPLCRGDDRAGGCQDKIRPPICRRR